VNIKKTGTGLIVAMSMLAFNAAAQDNCVVEIANIKAAADNLRCSDVDGNGIYWNHAPIWQYAAGNGRKKQDAVGDGCDVHQKLARLLYEKPVVKESNGKGKPTQDNQTDGRGAARALEDHQYTYAIQLLAELKASIETSVLNPDPDWGTVTDATNGNFPGDAQYWADVYWKFADDTQRAIDDVNMVCYSDINP